MCFTPETTFSSILRQHSKALPRAEMAKAQISTTTAALEVELLHLGISLGASKGNSSIQNQAFTCGRKVVSGQRTTREGQEKDQGGKRSVLSPDFISIPLHHSRMEEVTLGAFQESGTFFGSCSSVKKSEVSTHSLGLRFRRQACWERSASQLQQPGVLAMEARTDAIAHFVNCGLCS